MTFAAPAWLLVAVLAALVLLAHARRRRPVGVASIMLWQALQPPGGRKRARRPPRPTPALWLQLLAILIAALALAGPRFGGANRAEHVIFVIDNSGSMRATDVAPSRFAAAEAALVAEIGAALGDGARVSVITAGGSADIVVARQADAAGLLPLVEAIEPGDAGADWPDALGWIASVARANERTRLVILTDTADDARVAAATAFPDLPVTVARFGNDSTANAGLAATIAPIDAAADRWRIDGTVTLAGGAPVPTAIHVRYGRDDDTGFLDLDAIPIAAPAPADAGVDPLAVRTVSFTTELALPGRGRLVLELPDDAGPHDNAVRFVLLGEPKPVRILLVGTAEPNLVRALAALGTVDLRAASSVPADLRNVDLVVVNDVAVDRRPDTNVLWLGRGRLSGEAVPQPLATTDPTAWETSHPLSRNVDWTALEGPPAYGVARLPGADMILEAGGAPLVQARTTAAGREIRVALATTSGSWAVEAGFPVFIANVAAWLDTDAGLAVAPGCIAGEACGLPARLLANRITAPDGTIIREAGDFGRGAFPGGVDEAFVPDLAGFYTAERGSEAAVIAVNAATAGEADIRSTGSSDAARSTPFRLWGWLVAAMLLVLVAEAWISGRGVERFLQAVALRAGVPNASRRRAILALRLLAIAMVAAAFVRAPLPVREPGESVIAVYAAGPGAPAASLAALDAELAESRRVGRVAAGAINRVAIDPGADGTTGAAPDDVPGANLENAVRLAAAMLPAGRDGRIVLAATGNETDGTLGAALPRLQARSIIVDAQPLPAMPAGEVLVGRVEVPAHVRSGDTFPVNAMIYSQAPVDGRVAILRGGDVMVEETVPLKAGWNRIETSIPATTDPTLVEIAVSATTDVFPENNRDGAFVVPDRPPRILVVASEIDWGNFLATALLAQNLATEVIDPDAAPRTLAGWLAYDVVILMNVPALALTTARQDLLETAVAVHGIGLMILGGEHAFGPGGYYQTALERLSPLSSRLPQEAPRAAIVFVIDRSGSMVAPVEDVTRLDIAREATLGAVALLHDDSQVGVVMFDAEARIVVPMQPRKDEAALAAALAPVTPGGGTLLFPALAQAVAMFDGVEAEQKHIIVITDGLVGPAELNDFPALLAEAAAAGITVSTVAVGSPTTDIRLTEIAAAGGGTYYATGDFKALPSILAQDTMYLSSSPVVEGTRPVYWTSRSADFLTGLPATMPPIRNYVTTTAKPEADLHLVTVDDDGATAPILASWRYGNGRVLALATHGAGSGTQDWLGIPEYPLLWAQAARQFVPGVEGPGLHVRLDRDGDRILVVADLVGSAREAVVGRTVTATLDGGLGILLRETIPGQYSGSLPAGAGTHLIRVDAENDAATASIHFGYPAGFDFTRATPDQLAAVAAATGGELVADAAASLGGASTWRLRPEWRAWLLLALAFFLADLTLRQSSSFFRNGRTAPMPRPRPQTISGSFGDDYVRPTR